MWIEYIKKCTDQAMESIFISHLFHVSDKTRHITHIISFKSYPYPEGGVMISAKEK